MKKIRSYVSALCCAWLLISGCVACSSETSHDGGDPDHREVRIWVHAPTPAKEGKLPGDPGEEVEEGDAWDRITLIFAYGAPAEVYQKTWTRKEFDEAAVGEDDARLLAMEVRTGSARVFGLTYTEAAADVTGLSADLRACRNLSDVEGLTISNRYAYGIGAGATMDKAQFVSVATGYVPKAVTVEEADPDDIKPLVNLRLTRLATKIDIQYAADDSYNGRYTEVSIPAFTFYGTEKGYLFPALNEGKALDPESQGVTFVNTTPISQLNGRVYHYTFTDGCVPAAGETPSVPYVAFKIRATDNQPEPGEQADVQRTYNLRFPRLEQAAWYKGNLKLNGFTTEDGEVIEIGPSGQ